MRIVQTIIQKLACVAVLAGGVAVLVFPISSLYAQITAQLPGPNLYLRVAIGCAAAALALFALIPLGVASKKSRQLTFDEGPIELDTVAAYLSKKVGKLPVIKKVTMHVDPNKAAKKALVVADVSIIKPADTGARETQQQLRVYIDELARDFLGANEIEDVKVRIVGIDGEKTTAPIEWKEPEPAASPTRATAVTAPVAEGLVLSQAAAQPAPSSELVTYEESMQAVEDEEEALTGPGDEDQEEEPLPVAWEQEIESSNTASVGEDPEAPLGDESDVEIVDENSTSFAELADDEPMDQSQTPDSGSPEETRRDVF